MIKILKGRIQNRKVKVFLLFLGCSSMAWLISNLSDTYTSNTIFTLEYSNVPDSLLFNAMSKEKIEVKLRASGFQFLGFGLKKKKVVLDMRSVEFLNDKYFVSQRIYKRQIERQLSSSIELQDIDSDTIFFDFSRILSRELPIQADVEITLAQNYLMENAVTVMPNTVTIHGPKNEIDTISMVYTEPLQFKEIAANFKRSAQLLKSPALKNTTYSISSIIIEGKVSKFSEKIVDVPVAVLHTPKGVKVRVFPNKVSVLCKASLEALKKLKATDFVLSVDYNEINDSINKLPIKISKEPKNLYSAHLLELNVEYILNRE